MKISILSVFPELHEPFLKTSLIKRAQEDGLIEVKAIAFSQFCEPKERIDEPTCGPGPGMVLKPSVVEKALEHVQSMWGKGHIIFFSPQGKMLSTPLLKKLYTKIASKPSSSYASDKNEHKKPHVILVCSRYEGVDARVEEHYADDVLSIGNFVVMGGDIPAQLFLEAFLRLVPRVVGNEASLKEESFEGPLLDFPAYGLPLEWRGKTIPEVILSGNHKAINQWREHEAFSKTLLKRPDWLFSSTDLTPDDRSKALSMLPAHYVVLMHNDVLVKGDKEGVTSITSIDVHDAARSCETYGIKNLFIVSSLIDQQMILKTLLDFWNSSRGKAYNSHRAQALDRVECASTIDEAIHTITTQEGIVPLLIATSAKATQGLPIIDYASQGMVWEKKRPILFIFGTGQGLSPALLKRCDYITAPIEGLPLFNHLSVRAAIAIVLDRWLGLKPLFLDNSESLDKESK